MNSDRVVLYFEFSSLYISIISPLNRLYFSVDKLKGPIPSILVVHFTS